MSTLILGGALFIAQIMLGLAMALAVWRIVRGPRAQDRVLGIDTLCRTAFGTEVPPGVATAFVGTPVFIALLAASFRRAA